MPVEDVYRVLDQAWGPQHWWPARTPFEMIAGAILTQNTAWSNVERALANLDRAGALDLKGMHRAPVPVLAEWIRPSGYYNVKAGRLRAFTSMVMTTYDGSLDRMLNEEPARLRRVLLAVKGIGPETADSILLYATGHPAFVVDAYTRRVLSRHGWLERHATYDGVARVFTAVLPPDAAQYGQYHALLVHLGKKHCRPRPECASCPLHDYLPREGLVHED